MTQGAPNPAAGYTGLPTNISGYSYDTSTSVISISDRSIGSNRTSTFSTDTLQFKNGSVEFNTCTAEQVMNSSDSSTTSAYLIQFKADIGEGFRPFDDDPMSLPFRSLVRWV